MKYNKYSIFLKIVECGSLRKAAELTNYSQSAVSQALSSLEDELGIKLLNRTHSSLSLTAEGEQLIPYIRKICNDDQELMEKIDQLLDLQTGLIRIGTFSSISCHILAPALHKFKQKYPKITFDLKQGDYKEIESWLNDNIVDIGIVHLPTRKDFEPICVFKHKMMAVLPKDHHLANKKTVPLSLYAEEPFILIQEGVDKVILKKFREENIKPNIAYVSEDDYTIMSMVENDLGISILAELVLQKNTYDILVKDISPRFYREIGLAINKDHQPSIATNIFIEFFKDYLKKNEIPGVTV